MKQTNTRIYKQVAWLVLLVACCSCSRDENAQSGLVFWSATNPEEFAFAANYIDLWNKQHPDAPIHLQPVPEGQSSEEVILAAVVGSTTPDMYANMWQGDVEDFARSGVLVRLDTLDGFMEFMQARCDSLTLAEITSADGYIYQIPWKVNPIMMMYNPDMFASHDVIDPPATYSTFLAAGASLKKDNLWLGISESNAIWWQRFFNFLPLYYAASGGAPLIKDGKAIFNNEHGVAVFSFLQKVYNSGYFPREQMRTQRDPFLASQLAMTFRGPWTIKYNEEFKPEGFNYAFRAVPVPDEHTGPSYTYGDPKNIVIFNTCRNPEAAWQFLKTLLTAEADMDFLSMSGQFPRRKDLNTNPLFTGYFSAHPELLPFAEQALYVRGMDMEPYMKEVLDLISQEYEVCVVYGLKTPEEAIADAAKAVELLYLD